MLHGKSDLDLLWLAATTLGKKVRQFKGVLVEDGPYDGCSEWNPLKYSTDSWNLENTLGVCITWHPDGVSAHIEGYPSHFELFASNGGYRDATRMRVGVYLAAYMSFGKEALECSPSSMPVGQSTQP